VASLVFNGELVFMTAGFPEHHIQAIRPDGRGNVTDTHVVWHTESLLHRERTVSARGLKVNRAADKAANLAA